jgi:hypothetical protein
MGISLFRFLPVEDEESKLEYFDLLTDHRVDITFLVDGCHRTLFLWTTVLSQLISMMMQTSEITFVYWGSTIRAKAKLDSRIPATTEGAEEDIAMLGILGNYKVCILKKK